MSNQLMTVPDIVRGVEPECLQLVQSHNSVNWGAEANYAMQLLCGNDYALGIAQKNPVSVQNALRNSAAIGISLNPASKHAYLVPRQGAICLDISYMGLLHLAQSTGSIEWGQAKIVYKADTYENLGIDKAPLHKYPAFGERGDIIGVYCVVKTQSGDYLTEEMSIGQVYEVRARSEAYSGGKNKKPPSGPWVTDEEEMIRKTVVKRANKYWPKSDRLDQAIQYLNTDGGEGISKDDPMRDISPITQASEAWLTDYRNSLDESKHAQFDKWLKIPICQLTEIDAKDAIKAIQAHAKKVQK